MFCLVQVFILAAESSLENLSVSTKKNNDFKVSANGPR